MLGPRSPSSSRPSIKGKCFPGGAALQWSWIRQRTSNNTSPALNWQVIWLPRADKRSWNIKNREWHEIVVPTQLFTSARTILSSRKPVLFSVKYIWPCEDRRQYVILPRGRRVRYQPVFAPQRHREAFAPSQDICGT